MMRLQNDNVSLPARSLVPLLRDADGVGDAASGVGHGPVDKARALLLAWNFSVDADSVAAGIYEMWQRRVTRQYPQPRGAEGGAAVHRPAEHEAGHRLAERARRPLRDAGCAMSTHADATNCWRAASTKRSPS